MPAKNTKRYLLVLLDLLATHCSVGRASDGSLVWFRVRSSSCEQVAWLTRIFSRWKRRTNREWSSCVTDTFLRNSNGSMTLQTWIQAIRVWVSLFTRSRGVMDKAVHPSIIPSYFFSFVPEWFVSEWYLGYHASIFLCNPSSPLFNGIIGLHQNEVIICLHATRCMASSTLRWLAFLVDLKLRGNIICGCKEQ